MLHPNLTQKQIGEQIGFSREAVTARINAARFQRALAIAKRPALEIFQTHKAAAARRLGDLIHSEDERVALRACIAHLWQFIHGDDAVEKGAFVTWCQEAFKLANQTTEERARLNERLGTGASFR